MSRSRKAIYSVRGSDVLIKRIAPWPDHAEDKIYEGDRIRHPDGTEGCVYFLDSEADPQDQWRVIYDSADTGPGRIQRMSRLCLQIGDKGQAVVVCRPELFDPPTCGEIR